jgi:hypothetical protein
MIVLDVPYIFECAGGPAGLQRLLEQHTTNKTPNYAAVQMWRQRAAIPAVWIAPTLYALVKAGHKWGEFIHDTEPF